jgi:serine/threonine-protein kinase
MRIVHRDLKPSNLFLAETPGRPPIVKVLDFGISKIADAPTGALTKTASVMGTPFYMSPEQLLSAKNVDLRSDIWSLGVIIYELLAGHPPFWGETQPEVIAKILENCPPPLRPRRPDVPPLLESVISRCMRTRADERFSSVGDLAIALLPFGGAEDRERVAAISRVLGLPTDVISGSLAQVTLAAPAPEIARTARLAHLPDTAGATMRSPGADANVASADSIVMTSLVPPAGRPAVWLAALAGVVTLVAIAGVVMALRSQRDADAVRVDTVSPEPPSEPGALAPPATIAPLPPAPPATGSPEPAGFTGRSEDRKVPRPVASPALPPLPAGEPPPVRHATQRQPPPPTGARNPLDMGLK